MAEVKTKNAGVVKVNGGKTLEVKDGVKHLKEGTTVTTFKNSDRTKFKVEYGADFKGTKHVPEGTLIDMHILDAAIADKLGKGKVVKSA